MKFQFKDKECYIDGILSDQLNTLIYNVKNDFDFVIIITGDRSVRVGKSVLAMQVACYLSQGLEKAGLSNSFSINDIYFDNKEMMKEAFKKDKYHINLYDEGREGLAANKSMKQMQQDLLDFFAECGQMNHIFIIVAPDFFRLNEEIAVARSEYLINVYRKDVMRQVDLFKTGEKIPVTHLKRGQFEFFNRKSKQNLYDKSQSTRRRNYGLIKANFIGSFTNNYPIDEETYRNKKKEALARFTEKKEQEKKEINTRSKQMAEKYQYVISELTQGYKKQELLDLADKLGVPNSMLYEIKRKMNKMNIKPNDDVTKDDIEASKKQDLFKMPTKNDNKAPV